MRALVAAILLFAAPASALTAPASALAVTVRVAADAVVDTDDIRLGDIASVDAAEPLAARLRALRIAPAPSAGGRVTLDGASVRRRVRAAAGDDARVELAGAGRVVVTRASQLVTGHVLTDAARREALALLAHRGERDVVVTAAGMPDDLRLPVGELTLKARIVEGPPGSAFLSAQVVPAVDGRALAPVSFTLRAARTRPVVVATRALAPGALLSAADLAIESRPTTDVPMDALAALPDTTDLETLQSFRPGDPVTPRGVRRKPIVKRGEIVALVIEARGLRVTAQGQAAEDGRRGDTIRVINQMSKREVHGRVEAGGLVRVPFQIGREP